MEPTVTAGKDVAPSFMELTLAPHTVTGAAQDIVGTLWETDSNDGEKKP